MDRAVIALNDPGDALDQLVIFHRALMRTWMLRAKMRDPRDRQSSLHYGASSTTAAVLPPFRKRKSLIDYAKAQVPCSHSRAASSLPLSMQVPKNNSCS